MKPFPSRIFCIISDGVIRDTCIGIGSSELSGARLVAARQWGSLGMPPAGRLILERETPAHLLSARNPIGRRARAPPSGNGHGATALRGFLSYSAPRTEKCLSSP